MKQEVQAIKYAALLFLSLCMLCAGRGCAQTLPIPITITVQPKAKQTLRGFGASCLNFSGDYQKLNPAQRQEVSRVLWHDTGFRILRLWFNTDQYAPTAADHNLTEFRRCYVDSNLIADARKNGVTTLLITPDHLPPYMAEKRPDGSAETGMALKYSEVDHYAALVAGFLWRLKQETGIVPNATGIHNEPNDTFRFTPSQIVQVVKRLRVDLDARGLKQIGIIATENGSVNNVLYAQIDALKADPQAWTSLRGIASHSYNMGATDDVARRVRGTGKEYWMTEASDNGPEAPGDALRASSLASRFLGDVDHGVTHWIHFIGAEVLDANDNATRMLAYTVNPFQITLFQKYFYYQQLARAFDVGAVFRQSESSLDADMAWTYGKKPHLTAAAARNPDGSWSIGLSNYTSSTFSDADDDNNVTLHNSGYAARTFDVTIHVPELVNAGTVHFVVHRSNSNINDMPVGIVVMHSGVMTIADVHPLDLITLRSIKSGCSLQPLFSLSQNRRGKHTPAPSATSCPWGDFSYFSDSHTEGRDA